GEIDMRQGSDYLNVEDEVAKGPLADLPLEGEMPGRAEGGKTSRTPAPLYSKTPTASSRTALPNG
ncbi:hypothetical protein C241_01789, partial [Bradyrhizobium lupini HPC(L)]